MMMASSRLYLGIEFEKEREKTRKDLDGARLVLVVTGGVLTIYGY